METAITGSELTVPTTTESQRAWHLAGLMLSIGHPTLIAELTFRCTSFSTSRELVEFLCSIPNSPILLTRDLYVTLSPVAQIAFGDFVRRKKNLGVFFLPRIVARFHSTTRSGDNVNFLRTYFRKRKLNMFPGNGIVPVTRREVVLSSRNADEVDPVTLPSPKRVRYWSSGVRIYLLSFKL
ncbi:Protein kinase domain [Quillaja saponaria]|uniref:Protein kinase domain n=1 Tax=Quillaja saponaria TaxID=32244 RepID=A0AAD7KS27_QUISA|nr:Protein kinase domain [Quillaja saponaria]